MPLIKWLEWENLRRFTILLDFHSRRSAVQDTAKDEVQKALYGLLADDWQEVAQHQIKWKILLSEATGSQLIAAPF